jgi:hypothetical protein
VPFRPKTWATNKLRLNEKAIFDPYLKKREPIFFYDDISESTPGDIGKEETVAKTL